MKSVLTREELLEAQKAFWCEDWEFYIQEILDSSDSETIEIEDKYLNLIKEEATWKQITFCKALNLDLKMNLPEEAKEFVLEKIKACEVVKINEFITYYNENGKPIFILDSKNKKFRFDYDHIYQFLREKYSLKNNEIKELIINTLEEQIKLEGYRLNFF